MEEKKSYHVDKKKLDYLFEVNILKVRGTKVVHKVVVDEQEVQEDEILDIVDISVFDCSIGVARDDDYVITDLESIFRIIIN